MDYYMILGASFVVLHLILMLFFRSVPMQKRLALSAWVLVTFMALPLVSSMLQGYELIIAGVTFVTGYALLVLTKFPAKERQQVSHKPTKKQGKSTKWQEKSRPTGTQTETTRTERYAPVQVIDPEAAEEVVYTAPVVEEPVYATPASMPLVQPVEIGREQETMVNVENDVERHVAERTSKFEEERAAMEAELAEQLRQIEESAQAQEERVQEMTAQMQDTPEEVASPTTEKHDLSQELFGDVIAETTPQDAPAVADDLLTAEEVSLEETIAAQEADRSEIDSFFNDAPAATTVAPIIEEEHDEEDDFVADFLASNIEEAPQPERQSDAQEAVAEEPTAVDLTTFDFSDNTPATYSAADDDADYSYYEFLIYEAREMLEAGDIQETVDYFKEVIVDCQKRELRKEALNFLELIRVDLYDRSAAELAQEEEYTSLKRRRVND